MALDATEVAIILKAYDQASGTIRQVEQTTTGLGSTFDKVSHSALGVAAGIAAIAGAGSVIDAIGGVVVGFNSKLEQSAVSWKTFTGSAEAAQAVLVQVQQIAATTPFEFADVDKAAKRFVNAGFSAQQALNFVLPLSNAVASVGLGAEGVDRVSLALAQMTQKGKVSGEEMLQLTEAQIPAWEILAQATGKPIPELQKLVTQGKITAQAYTEAFATFYGEGGKFANAAKDQSLTFAGSMSTIRDELNIVGSTAFQPLFKALSDGARAFAAFVQSDQFTVWGARIQAVVGFVVDGLGGLSSAFSSTLGGVLNIVSTVGQAIYGALQWINPFASHSPPLVSQVQDGVAAIKTAYGSLDSVSGTFDTVRAAFENLNGVTANFSASFGDDLPTKVEKALAIMGPGATDAFNSASAAIDAAKASVADIKTEWESATAALVPLKDSLDAAKDSLKDQQTTLSDLKSQLSDAKTAYDPLNQQLKDVQQNAKDAEQAIKSLTSAPIAGSAEFDKKISSANIGIKEQALGLSQVKQSTAYQSLGDQIETATAKLKEMQRSQATFIPNLPTGASKGQQEAHAKAIEHNRELADQARRAIADQQAALDVLKDKQKDLLDPAQKELDKRRQLLDTLNLEKDATIGVAQERIKAAGADALGIKEQTEKQIVAGIATAKAARDAALGQEATLSPQVKAQEEAIKAMESAIRSQEHAVADAHKTVDAANTSYSDAKTLVDDLGSAYRSGKAEIAGYDQQLKQLIQTGELQVQKADEAKKAADKLAKSGSGATTAKTDVLAGLDIEGSKKKIQAFQDQVASTRSQLTGHLDAIRGKWDSAWAGVTSVIDRVLARFGGFSAIQPALDFLGRFGVAVAALVVGLAGVGGVVGGFLSALAPFAPALAVALTPVGLLTVGIAALAAAWTLNVGNIQQSAGGLVGAFAPLQDLPAIVQKAFGGDVTGALNEFVVVLQSVRGKVIATLAGWAAAFVDWLLPQLPALTTQLTTFASSIIGCILGQGDKFVANLLAWGTAFVNWLTPRIPAILAALSDVGLRILQWIRDQGTIIASRLGEWAAAFIKWVIPLLPQLGTAIEQIATAVVGFVASAVPTILGALIDWAGAFLGWVVPLLPALLGALGALVVDLGRWVVAQAPLIGDKLGEWKDKFLTWASISQGDLSKNLDTLVTNIKQWVTDNGPAILDRGKEIGGKIADGVVEGIDTLKTTAGPALRKALATAFGEDAATKADAFGAGLSLTLDTLGKNIQNVVDWLGRFSDALAKKGVADDLKTAWKNLGDAAAILWPVLQDAARELGGMLKSIKDLLAPTRELNSTLSGGANSSDKSADNAAQGFKNLSQDIRDLSQGIKDGIQFMKDVGTALNSINAAVVGAGIAVHVFVVNVEKAFDDAGAAFSNAGAQVILGLIKGIGTGADLLGTAVQDYIVTPLVDSAKKLLGIASPSTVFAEIGGQIVDGLLSGLEGKTKDLVDWITGLFGKTGRFIQAIPDAGSLLVHVGSDILSGLKDGLDSFWTASDGLWAWLKALPGQILDTLTAMKPAEALVSIGTDLLSGLKGGLEAFWTASGGLWEWLNGLLGQMWSTLAAQKPGEAFVSIGKDLMSGLLDGLKSKWADIGDWFSNLKWPSLPAMPNFGGGGAGGGPAPASGNSAEAGARSVAGWDPKAVESYIRETAAKYGIDPQTAVRVAGHEGLTNPVGDAGMSFGPFQLYTGGGLGNQFQQQTGMDPANFQNNWKAQVDFALDWATKHGWNPGGARTPTGAIGGGFHGATVAGIGNWEGIGVAVKDAAPALDDLNTQVDSVSNDVLQSIPHLKDYGFTIQSLGDSAAPAGAALDDLATQTGKPRGAFLEMSQVAQTSLGATVDAVVGVGNNKMWQVIDSNAAIAGKSLKKWLEDSGATSINVATASLADLERASGLTLPQIQIQAQGAGKDIKQWLQDTGVPATEALAVSLGLMSESAVSAMPPIDGVNKAVGDLSGTIILTGNPAIDSFNAALAKIPDQAKAAAQAYRDLVTAMDNNQASSGPGGSLRQAASVAADIGVHSVMAASGLISTLAKSYAQMSEAEKEAANRFAAAYPNGLSGSGSGGGNSPSSSAPSGSSGGNASPFPSSTIGSSGPGGKYNDPSTGKPYTRAAGGPIQAGQHYLVGERGAELITPIHSAMVHSAGATAAIASALVQMPSAETMNHTAAVLAHLRDSFDALPRAIQITAQVQDPGTSATQQMMYVPPPAGAQSGGGGMDYDRLADRIADKLARAIQSQPAPRVAVEDIRSELWRVGRANGGVVGLA